MHYPGGELELFKDARHWKRYWSGQTKPFVTGRVLDAGCGIGANAEWLMNTAVTGYTFLEPDARLLSRVPAFATDPVLAKGERIIGTTTELSGRVFDTILYIDVIEHIEDAAAELRRAYGLLAPGGRIIIVVPAFQYLFSAFDTAVGHHRRYTKRLLKENLPEGMEVARSRYLDSLGLLLSLGNKWFLKQGQPTAVQIAFWDRRVVPISRVLDPIMLHSFGRSLFCVARKPAS